MPHAGKDNPHGTGFGGLGNGLEEDIYGRAVSAYFFAGLLDMHKAGAYTIGQDKESCVVYGMPMVAQNIGAVTIQASCANIPSVLMNYLNTL